MCELRYGEHLYVSRVFYQHHGIYVGGHSVIHYLRHGITLTGLEEFSRGNRVHTIFHPGADYPQAVERAYSRLFEDKYDIVFNNCETFVNWCFTGKNISYQVIERAAYLLDKLF